MERLVFRYKNINLFSWNSLISDQHIKGVGRSCVGMGWVVQKLKQRSKKTQVVEFRVATVYACLHAPTKGQYSNTRPRQTCTGSGSHIRSTQPNWSPPLALFHQSWIYMVTKKYSGKADQSTLASGGSEHA